MDCEIKNKDNIRIFAKILQCLAKVGEDVTIEIKNDEDRGPDYHYMQLVTINSAQSAYAQFRLEQTFFETFAIVPNQSAKSFKILLKTLLSVFRAINSIQAVNIVFNTNKEPDKILINLTCYYDMMKSYKLSYMMCEPLQAEYRKDEYKAHLFCNNVALMSDLLSNFQSNLAEVSFILNKHSLNCKSYVDEETSNLQEVLMTNLSIELSEFEVRDFKLEDDEICEMTFNVKDFKAFLGFCEMLNFGFDIYLDKQGKPIIFSTACMNDYGEVDITCDLLLATIQIDPSASQTLTTTTTDNDSPNISSFSKSNRSSNNRVSKKRKHDHMSADQVMSPSTSNDTSPKHYISNRTPSNHTDIIPTQRSDEDIITRYIDDGTNPSMTSEYQRQVELRTPNYTEDKEEIDATPSPQRPKKKKRIFRDDDDDDEN